jgi:glucose-1-phosphate thymidylyltransferase
LNIIISFAGLESSQSSTPFALRRLAGSTILGHILTLLLDLPVKKLILIVSSGIEQVERTVRENLPDLSLHMLLVEDTNDPITALNECRSVLDSEQLLFVSGNYIAEAEYWALISGEAGASCLIQVEQDAVPAEVLTVDDNGFLTLTEGGDRVRWAGSCWFRHGTDLIKALEAVDGQKNYSLGSLLSHLATHGVQISTKQAFYCLDTRSVENMLNANARLLWLDHGTQDAIERSYAEDFTVLPPVFLHETAVIENSVIGPFVNIEAHATVRNSIVRNSLIGTGTKIADAILNDSLIGDAAVITGLKSTVIAGDGAVIELGKEQTK